MAHCMNEAGVDRRHDGCRKIPTALLAPSGAGGPGRRPEKQPKQVHQGPHSKVAAEETDGATSETTQAAEEDNGVPVG